MYHWRVKIRKAVPSKSQPMPVSYIVSTMDADIPSIAGFLDDYLGLGAMAKIEELNYVRFRGELPVEGKPLYKDNICTVWKIHT